MEQDDNNININSNSGPSTPPSVFESGNSPAPEAPKKKKPVVLIVVVILIVIATLVALLIFMLNKPSDSGNSNNGTSADQPGQTIVEGSDIVQVAIDQHSVLMLNKKGELYLGGNITYGPEAGTSAKMIASNVKSFNNTDKLVVLYNDGKVTYSGLSVEGMGTTKELSPLTDNIKIAAANSACIFMIDNDGNYIVRAPIGNQYMFKYCALPDEHDGNFSKIATGAKEIYNGAYINGYLDGNNDLYVSNMDEPGYTKVMSRVKKMAAPYIIDEDGALYSLSLYGNDSDQKVGKVYILKVDDNVADVYSEAYISGPIYKTTGGVFKYASSGNDNIYLSAELGADYSDMKLPYFYNGLKAVYLNNDNKLVLFNKTTSEKQTLELSTESISKIIEFLK